MSKPSIFRITDEGCRELEHQSLLQRKTDFQWFLVNLESLFNIKPIIEGYELNNNEPFVDAVCVDEDNRLVIVRFERTDESSLAEVEYQADLLSKRKDMLEKLYKERYKEFIIIEGKKPIKISLGEFSNIDIMMAKRYYKDQIRLYKCTLWEEKWYTVDPLWKRPWI